MDIKKIPTKSGSYISMWYIKAYISASSSSVPVDDST